MSYGRRENSRAREIENLSISAPLRWSFSSSRILEFFEFSVSRFLVPWFPGCLSRVAADALEGPADQAHRCESQEAARHGRAPAGGGLSLEDSAPGVELLGIVRRAIRTGRSGRLRMVARVSR